MNTVFTAPRTEDAFYVAARKPLSYFTPSIGSPSSFGQSRQDKGRPVSMSIFPSPSSSSSNSTTPIAIPVAAKSRFANATTVYGPPSPATFVGYPSSGTTPQNNSFFAPATPVSPNTPSLLALASAALNHGGCEEDEEMTDTFATPSVVRVLPLAQQPRTSLPTKKVPSIQTAHLQCPTAPLTPPLTPPSPYTPALLPSLDLNASPTPLPQPKTISARLLAHHTLHPLFEAQYTICEELGAGGFGFVVRAMRNSDGLSVAVKFIERSKIPAHGWAKSKSWGPAPGLSPMTESHRMVPMEAFVLRNVRHDGVVAFIDLFEDDKYFYLIMEHHGSPWQSNDKEPESVTSPSSLPALAAAVNASSSATQGPQTMTPSSSPTLAPSSLPNLSPPRPAPMERRTSCDLFECIEQHSRFNEQTAKYVFAQIVEVVSALGRIGICHRDIKDENIVISSDFKVKLIDFGSAVIFDPRQPAPLYNRFHGTTSFAAAEILRGEPYHAPTSEIWSLGVLLSILVTGECPFVDAEAAKAGRISRPKVRLGYEVEHLLHACLEVDTTRRIDIEGIKNHPWLRPSTSSRR